MTTRSKKGFQRTVEKGNMNERVWMVLRMTVAAAPCKLKARLLVSRTYPEMSKQYVRHGKPP